MPKYTLEEGESSKGEACACCGEKTRTVWGYIKRDGIPRAVYYVSWTQRHQERGALFLLSVGDWEAKTPNARESFALAFRLLPTGPAFMIVDASETNWARNELLGVMLDRETALASPLKTEVFAIADGILGQDKRFQSFFEL